MSTSGLKLPTRTEAEARAARARFKLIDGETGAEITLPATRKCWDGYEITIKTFRQSPGAEGFIFTTANEVYVPSVCGAKIVEFPASDLDVLVGKGMPI
jgi:hypothetical protein